MLIMFIYLKSFVGGQGFNPGDVCLKYLKTWEKGCDCSSTKHSAFIIESHGVLQKRPKKNMSHVKVGMAP